MWCTLTLCMLPCQIPDPWREGHSLRSNMCKCVGNFWWNSLSCSSLYFGEKRGRRECGLLLCMLTFLAFSLSFLLLFFFFCLIHFFLYGENFLLYSNLAQIFVGIWSIWREEFMISVEKEFLFGGLVRNSQGKSWQFWMEGACCAQLSG